MFRRQLRNDEPEASTVAASFSRLNRGHGDSTSRRSKAIPCIPVQVHVTSTIACVLPLVSLSLSLCMETAHDAAALPHFGDALVVSTSCADSAISIQESE